MHLAVDIGNSTITVAIFHGGELITCRSTAVHQAWENHLRAILEAFHIDRVGLSSVSPVTRELLLDLLKSHSSAPILEVRHGLTLPFAVAYHPPGALGADRLAAAAAAWHCYGEGHPTIVIDAGTALTVDVIRDGTFLGGTISAGPDLESSALATGTAALPRITLAGNPEVIGTSTIEAMRAGVLHGLTDRVHGSLHRLSSVLGSTRVVVATGGWHTYLAQHVMGIDHADPHLVVRGVQLLMAMNSA